ncbi:hypothetical protein Y1Q_0011787 [Alligator mississippiensis]|uniref:Uncharacterized protein n=1 Tax=Alligator mississippiensis TaxID=8496 RepID=A0A151M168_ALLMI|nr:hypothetical protein Y1Q_0011787 [Alligator mississippiensis]
MGDSAPCSSPRWEKGTYIRGLNHGYSDSPRAWSGVFIKKEGGFQNLLKDIKTSLQVMRADQAECPGSVQQEKTQQWQWSSAAGHTCLLLEEEVTSHQQRTPSCRFCIATAAFPFPAAGSEPELAGLQADCKEKEEQGLPRDIVLG